LERSNTEIRTVYSARDSKAPSGPRIQETELVAVRQVLDENDDLLSYLPEVVAGVETKISTKTIRDDLGITSHPRELVVIVFVMLDGTIRELKGEEYWQVFWDCLRCEFALCPLVRFSYKHNRS
jgi:hypothetical protein